MSALGEGLPRNDATSNVGRISVASSAILRESGGLRFAIGHARVQPDWNCLLWTQCVRQPPGEGDSPQARCLESPPHPDPLPASGEGENTPPSPDQVRA